MKFDKLVRDKIPEIARGKGQTPVTHVADDAEYRTRLIAKLDEEVAEFKEALSAEELADVLEVIHGFCGLKGIAFGELDAIRQKKAEERGGFSGRIILDEVM